ncbi:hypothetical protein ABE494_06350 [Stenotrophomonas lactitubi]|uniref:hypothetical protein n=1 Tax=Stenotrophomonas lactitubi TaxID=2045214 RepID=UPI00203C51A3|nr:hypothetical protein [Stenotrophomonas lactitubi]
MPLTTSNLRSARLGLVALACFIILAVAAWASPGDAPSADAAEDVPEGLVITSPRICAALAVYELAAADDWGLRATVANTSLNAFRDASRVPDCAAGATEALTHHFEPARWQLALDAVDAVLSGSYQVSPAACVRANAVVPLSTADGKEPSASPVLVRAQCVMHELAFVEVAP